MNHDDAAVFANLARLLEAEPDLDATCDQIVLLAKQTLACDFAGITLLHGRKRVETIAATDQVVEKADALQYEFSEGPCLQAIWSHDTFLVADMRDDERWPSWGPQAAKLGLRSILAVRLFTHGETHGALNMYAASPRQFDDDDVAIAHIYATHAAVALAAVREQQELRKAIDSRHLIGQAQGILMERFDIGADRAFEVLRRYSQTNNLKLRDIADQIVANRSVLQELNGSAPAESVRSGEPA